jgi:CubicO group peptidase (beta-lactamase class C family)
MTAAVIVLLAQEGKLRFEDPVSMFPAFRMGTTLRSVSS